MRTILHVDANSFYASCECLYRPSIREKPVAVCGDPEARHGIVLTKNQHAKKYGVQTGEAIWQAKQKCPSLVVVPPDYPLYLHMSRQMHEIFGKYSDKVESFGLDEAWVDISADDMDVRKGQLVADEIRHRIHRTLGITVSVGVADNKVMAKLGSDYKKPDATTVLPPDLYEQIVWPLPVSDLLYVGPATTRKLARIGVCTIGQLANLDESILAYKFGKIGYMLKAFALGLDTSPVKPIEVSLPIKSVGNSTTPPHDIENMTDVKELVYLLAESVATRLRENNFKARCISVSARTTELISSSCQTTLSQSTCLAKEIAETALRLFEQRYRFGFPFRSMGINCSQLSPLDAPVQVDMFGEDERRVKQEQLERSIDGLRSRFGHQVIRRGIVLSDLSYSEINPKEEHIIHPVGFLR
ncbi:MAG: DNA polymerase IV [Clostridia bacterium]|nr:DNA polymerase IV [Clostridia bacterium]